MRDIEFLGLVRNSKLAVFTPKDISRLIRRSPDYVYTYLNRLIRRNLISRIEQGKYSLPGTPIESVATNLLFPSYISFLSAFYYHKITVQIPRELTIVSIRSKKPIEYQGYIIKFVKFQPEKVFGYERNKNGYVWYLGSVEKSLTDSLYLPENCSISDSLIAIKKGINSNKLIEYGIKMGSIVTLKRIGYLLDSVGIDVYDILNPHLNGKYDPLDPILPKNGEKDKKWKLVINTEVENAH
ncbi:MAG: hypothetical protein JSV56_13695 [Methanomassiliicoccales archaeon]|nr:MAG: hypothetical protein JSV56_13695 [Methanomassiliicoccales archaeon]